MDLVQWRDGLADPFQGFEDLQEEINKLFDLARPSEPRGIFERTFSPALDVVENGDSYGVLCDLPGLEIKDVEISLAGSVLTIKGEKRGTERREGKSIFREEAGHGRFQRTLQLPAPVDPDRIEAVLRDGVLKIILPKREEHKARQIAVKDA
jgi:HSP20 family protein